MHHISREQWDALLQLHSGWQKLEELAATRIPLEFDYFALFSITKDLIPVWMIILSPLIHNADLIYFRNAKLKDFLTRLVF